MAEMGKAKRKTFIPTNLTMIEILRKVEKTEK